MTMRPVPDRAEVSVDFPDKTYMGAFGRNAKFEAMCRPNDVVLKLRQTGAERRDVELHMHHMQDGKPLPDVVFNKTTLLEPNNIRSRQAASTVHVHPNGRFVYAANRSQDVVDFNGRKVYKGGENSIVVYAISQETGEPTAIQHIETQKIHPRTFHMDPSGRMLVAQHNLPVDVRDGDNVRTVSAGLSVFRMNEDGRLTVARTYDIDVGDKIMWWMGMVPL